MVNRVLKTIPLPDADVLRDLLRYNKRTGELHWKRRPRSMFSTDHEFTRWNTRYAEAPALSAIKGTGYRHGAIFGKPYLSHRVIWKMVTGEDPPDDIDHKNGRRDDNRWENLRQATRTQNARNAKLNRRNTSGVSGVDFYRPKRKWRARIGQKYLGQFDTKEGAIAARKAAEVVLDYHPNHGRET